MNTERPCPKGMTAVPVKKRCVLPWLVPITQSTSGVQVPVFVPEEHGTETVPGLQPWPSGRGKLELPGRMFMSTSENKRNNPTG